LSLGARLALAFAISPLLLALFLHNPVRVLAFPLSLLHVAISAGTVALPVMLPLLMGMLTSLSHDRLRRYCKTCAKVRL
jgi:hypothetical protein